MSIRSGMIARNSLLAALDTIVGFACALVSTVLVARAMGPEKLGYYSYIMWVVHITTVLATFGIPSAARKYVAEFVGRGDVATAKAVIRVSFRLQAATAVLLTSVGLVVACTLLPAPHRLYTAIALVSIVPAMLMSVPSAVNSAVEDFAANVWPSMISILLYLAGVVVAVWLEWGLVGLTVALLASRVADFAIRYALYKSRFVAHLGGAAGTVPAAVRLPPELKRRMTRFCWQASGLLLLNLVIWDRSEVFFLRRYCDIREVAFYSMSFGIVRGLGYVPLAFARAAGANLMAQQSRDTAPLASLAATTLRFLALVALPMALGAAVLSAPLIRLLYGARYEPAIPVLAIAAVFAIPAMLLPAVQDLLVAGEHQGLLLKWGIATAVLNLALDFWWIPQGGARGAALANGVAQSVAAIGIWVLAVRCYAISIPWRPLLKLVVSAVTMALVVRLGARLVPVTAAVCVGVPVGTVLFLLLLRLTRALTVRDRRRLMSIQSYIPRPLSAWYATTLGLVIPAAMRVAEPGGRQ